MIIPYILTLVFVIGLGLIAVVLFSATLTRRRALGSTTDTAGDFRPAGNLGLSATNGWLRVLRYVFLAACLGAIGMHSYWSLLADGPLSQGQKYANIKDGRDRRNIRLQEAGLRGWVFDRNNKPESALIRYTFNGSSIDRAYPLGPAAVHLTGYNSPVFGRSGFERAFDSILTQPLSTYNRLVSTVPVGKDVVSSIDSDLQREAESQLQGKKGAAVILDITTGEVLALATAPTYDPSSIHDSATWARMVQERDSYPEISPLVDRAYNFYYQPGSTFKTFIASVAVAEGKTNEYFVCKGEGFTPPGSGRSIRDFDGEVHGRIGFDDAFKVSCNQYFAQLGLSMGRDVLAKHAQTLGLAIDPNDAGKDKNIWLTTPEIQKDFNNIFAPPQSQMNLTSKATPFDVALQSFGQGYDSITVLQMAILAASVARTDGTIPYLKLTSGGEVKNRGVFIPPQAAAKVRQLMRLVVTSGTAQGAFAGFPIAVAGKTGTADRDVRKFNPQTREPIKAHNSQGNEYNVMEGETDGWFIGFAPYENPRIAFAVVIERGGQGARSAAPVARDLIAKAAQLGLMGNAGAQPQRVPARSARSAPPTAGDGGRPH